MVLTQWLVKEAIASQEDSYKELVLQEHYIMIQNSTFDESTSALDDETEAEIMKNIYSFRKKNFIIITIKKNFKVCDKIYELENGIFKLNEKIKFYSNNS